MSMATTSPSPRTASHHWRFYRTGGVDQVRIDTGADILHLDELDEKLWVALACPVQGLELDERTLALLDQDGDAHLRPPEIKAAVRWLRSVLKTADELAKGHDGVALANLRTDTDEGKALLQAAKHLLKQIGKSDASAFTVADVTVEADKLAAAATNGDGGVVPETIADAALQALATEVVTCTGGATDRSGKPGIDAATIDAFYAACADYSAWCQDGEAKAAEVLPFGDGTAAAYAAFSAIRGKVDDFFARCRVAAFDARALAALNREETAYVEAAAKDLRITAEELAGFPLAMVAANKPLPLTAGINPAWIAHVAAFRTTCCPKLEAIDEAGWAATAAKFAAYEAHVAAKKGGAVEALGLTRVRAILADAGGKPALLAACEADAAVATEVAAIGQLEKLARLHRDFATLLRNYVSFADFYARKGAIFQAGTLYLDGRALDLCFHVANGGKHAAWPRWPRRTSPTSTANAPVLHRCRWPAPSRRATATTSSRAATASSTTARATTGTPPSPRSSTTRSASAKPSGRRTRSCCAGSKSKSPSARRPPKATRPPSCKPAPRRPGPPRAPAPPPPPRRWISACWPPSAWQSAASPPSWAPCWRASSASVI
jgi:hypothetical protein